MADQRDLAQQLLGLARDDLAAARTLSEANSSASMVGFHCQQAVEKALKAVLARDGMEDLGDVDRLTPFAVHMRYGTAPTPAVELSSALTWAEQAIRWADGSVAA
jgi:hypothetical protein